MLCPMKLILRIGNLFPLFVALLIVGTVWRQVWEHVAARAGSQSVLGKLAGAALYQSHDA